jgi:hypothetical protein
MRRSGSTLQSNLVAALLGPDTRIDVTSVESFVAPEPSAAPLVLKCHRYIPAVAQMLAEGKARVFYSFRDIRDVVASIMEKYSVPALGYLHGGALNILREHAAWAALPGVHLTRYEDMVVDPVTEVARLAAHLGLPADAARDTEVAERFSLRRQRERIAATASDPDAQVGSGGNVRDRETLLHLNHIQSGGSGAHHRVMSTRERAALEWLCRDWMAKYEYEPEHAPWLQAMSWASYRAHAGLHRLRAGGDTRGRGA